ncbi:hypothetical protein M501DRAFT_411806 [Patellaria atrata CBS 101060]|uniref:Complex 1 LYR protein domain-containing protein n=1 Tax=Patellaria atrata CBS 101060 TaxID=1346257 RepID=A0A9P4SIE9_9PEZI|nr:hypothetical protein M501DRAFT_411806 [Patellaria atrata CBS 101060]
MPLYIHPKKLLAHRVAAIALYRGLLSACADIPFEPNQRTKLQNITRNRFKHNQGLQSKRLLRQAFYAGYEALNVLESAAAGDVTSGERILSILSQTPSRLTRRPKQRALKRLPVKDDRARTLPPGQKLLETRPHKHVTGIRRVPKLIYANGFPMLRIKKPQSHSVGRVIRQLVSQRVRRWEDRWQLEDWWIPMSRMEDRWDNILLAECGVGDVQESESKWEYSVLSAFQDLRARQDKTRDKGTQMARRMQEIVDQEQELANNEQAMRDAQFEVQRRLQTKR